MDKQQQNGPSKKSFTLNGTPNEFQANRDLEHFNLKENQNKTPDSKMELKSEMLLDG